MRISKFEKKNISLLDVAHFKESQRNEDQLKELEGKLVVCLNSFTTYEITFGQLRIKDAPHTLYIIDGFPVQLMLQLRYPSRKIERWPGPDFASYVLSNLPAGTKVALIGGREPVNRRAVNKLKTHNLNVQGFFDKVEDNQIGPLDSHWDRKFANFNPDIFIVCLGQPKQEIFASRLRAIYPQIPILCVGAFVDFLAEEQARAPKLLRHIGLEWLWRFLREPKRLWRRYLLKSPLGLVFFLTTINLIEEV